MRVPAQHVIARFIRDRRQDWDKNEQKPKPKAFSQVGLSIWSATKLNNRGATLQEVKSAGFEGCGVALFVAEDFHRLAEDAGRQFDTTVDIGIHWRPHGLPDHLKPWAYAHAEVDIDDATEGAVRWFRHLVASKCKHIIPPST